jgi:hypothetical protein
MWQFFFRKYATRYPYFIYIFDICAKFDQKEKGKKKKKNKATLLWIIFT